MPVLTVVAGPNGSGKSTLTSTLKKAGVTFGEYLNADDIARSLQGELQEISVRAQEIVREKRTDALDQRRDHTFETVMSHPSHIDYMIEAGQAGFEVRLFFVATEDPVVNLQRVANRVKHGGHDVPKDRIVARYHRSLGNLPAAIKASNFAEIFDNSSASRPLRRLAQIKKIEVTNASRTAYLSHREITRRHPRWTLDPSDIPVWWLDVLLRIKPENPFADGTLP